VGNGSVASGEAIKDGLPDCRQARLWRWSCDSFSLSRLSEATGFQEGISVHHREGMAMKAGP